MALPKNITKIEALQLSLIAIASVVLVEGIVGFLTNSLAILSDAVHASFDTVTTLILLVTTKLSLKPPDEDHLYGHSKTEPIGGLIGGIALIGLAILLLYEAGTRIIFGGAVQHELIGFGAVGYTLAVDCFRIGTLWGRGQDSLTVKAGFYHAISDFASTVIALLGFGLSYLGVDDRADTTASVVLSFLLIYLTIGLVRSSSAELSDAISKGVVKELRKEILSTKGVSMCKDLKARKVGNKTYVETTICVSNSMELNEAHDVASEIEAKVNRLYGDSSVTVHIEPVGTEKPIERQIESLAKAVEGVKGVHNLSNVYSKGKLYITLHALVAPQLPIQEAHKIAEKIEENLEKQIRDVENVTVHIEPYVPKIHRDFIVDDIKMQRLIKQIVEAYPNIRRVNRVVTYSSEKRRYVNIDCSFDKNVSVEVMHDTVSKVERELKKRFREAVLTIHAEPSQ